MITRLNTRIDTALIADRMTALGLSERELIRRTGLPNSNVRRLRRTGELEPSLTLRQLTLLSDTLGLTVAGLLSTISDDNANQDDTPDGIEPHDPDTNQPTDADPETDTATLIPLLLDLPKPVPDSAIARALGWTHDRTQAALDATPAALAATGLRLYRVDRRVTVISANPTRGTTKTALRQLRRTHTNLNAAEARVLAAVVDGAHVLDRQPSNAKRVAAQALINMGCLTVNSDNVHELSHDVTLTFPDL